MHVITVTINEKE